MTVTHVNAIPRGCGKRKRGVYVISGGGGGDLPKWVPIRPPIVRNGPQFRGIIQIDLDAMLVSGREVLVGASAERIQHETALSPEIQAFGMPYRMRTRTGLCAIYGPEGLDRLTLVDGMGLGHALRALGSLSLGKARAEPTRAFESWQKTILDRTQGYGPVLASLWRLWNNCPEQQKPRAVFWIQQGMKALNASEDADAIRNQYYTMV